MNSTGSSSGWELGSCLNFLAPVTSPSHRAPPLEADVGTTSGRQLL
ncbi:hypothetical protein KNP414_02164 [Paenibacillus mucilaginosus KNP414]|uniref:Uncharacterized protein n=1 Tax=Paenibacillus mucilaginosus (strain KNP414) TaxID=1036673 RepID=F8F4Z5_PAEMK|nr:hypothetical protein KNP414_02164 [Paenibacillus mucilaginosus KNP414]